MQIHIEHATIHLPASGVQLLGLPVRGQSADSAASVTSSATPPIGELWPGMGGYYVGILPAIGDRPAQHMIASTQEAPALKWGPYTEVAGAASRHDGRANTAALMAAGGKEFPAAWWCDDLQVGPLDDFHLPSQAELFLASLHAPQLFQKEGWYWSSTQNSRTSAFVQDFAHGDSYWFSEGYEFRVRAVRWIQL